MRILIIILIASLSSLNAQIRKEEPLLIFSKKPLTDMDKDVKGWSYSIDGQWLSSKNKIPVREVSTNKDAYKTKPNKLGLDNFSSFKLYPAIHGKDTLMLLIKIFKDGAYKYDRIEKGWKEYNRVYYYLLNKKEFRKLDAISDTNIQILKLNLLDDGEISDVKDNNIMEAVKARVRVNSKYNRQMVVMLQPITKINRIRFQIFSQHKIFNDVDGVLKDFTLNGKSLYGKPELFNYLYYETSIDNFSELVTVPNSFEFKI